MGRDWNGGEGKVRERMKGKGGGERVRGRKGREGRERKKVHP